VAIAPERGFLGDVHIPEGFMGFATVCSIVFNGVLLKRGIPMDSKFGGILQIHDHKPMRFVELIHYSGTSLDPSEAFISAKMTSVRDVAKRGEGNLLANFREFAGVCRDAVDEVVELLKGMGIGSVLSMGKMGEPICQVPVDVNKVGMILLGGLNAVAAARESGITVRNLAMSTVMDYKDLCPFATVYREYQGS
jgi:HTH-type transcriptional regulator, global nitrogen regulator NrpRI